MSAMIPEEFAVTSTWLALVRDSRGAANELVARNEHLSSAVSRAYYAVYAKVTHELTRRGVTMRSGYEGPAHNKLAKLVITELMQLDREKRLVISVLVRQLYSARLAADYHPSSVVDAREAREAQSRLKKIFELL